MRVIIAGTRTISDNRVLFAALKSAREIGITPTVIINGGGAGVDKLARMYARRRLPLETYAADWQRYGRSAGPIRNRAMIEARPDALIAIWDGESKGTANVIKQARRAGLRVYVHNV